MKTMMTFLFLVMGLCVSISVFAEADTLLPPEASKPVHSRVGMEKGLSRHKDMFILFGSYARDYKGKQSEVVFQISAKQSLYFPGLYFAYSQKSFWQAFDADNSSPFRETNYNPEIFYRIKPGRIDVFPENMGLDLGGEHESNGQRAPDSRSWNRLYAAPYVQYKNTLLYTKLWYRIPEDRKPYEEAPEGDDNPDIHRYLGYGEIHLYQNLGDLHTFHAMARATTHSRGALALNYSLYIPKMKCSLITYFFTGYGESLIDYNNSITRIGVGMSFNR